MCENFIHNIKIMHDAIMLTIVTKYSRIPSDSIKLKWCNALMDTGREPILISPTGSSIIRKALREKSKKLGIQIVNLAILPDHIHIIVITKGVDIPTIVQGLKGYTSYLHNTTFQGTRTGKGKQNALWAKGYSLTLLDSKRHLARAIRYVNDNHMKHEDKRGRHLLKKYQDKTDLYVDNSLL